MDTDHWDYCSPIDQRFQSEIISDDLLSDPVRLCNGDLHVIPTGTYDMGDGYYNPSDGNLYTYSGEFVQAASDDVRQWAVENCARAPLAACIMPLIGASQ